jgi:hypothetical protein
VVIQQGTKRCENLLHYFGEEMSVTIPESVETLCLSCFPFATIAIVEFENGSHLKQIQKPVFWEWSELRSIYIPSSVESICRYCFSGCRKLALVIFEPASSLSRIGQSAFSFDSFLGSNPLQRLFL